MFLSVSGGRNRKRARRVPLWRRELFQFVPRSKLILITFTDNKGAAWNFITADLLSSSPLAWCLHVRFRPADRWLHCTQFVHKRLHSQGGRVSDFYVCVSNFRDFFYSTTVSNYTASETLDRTKLGFYTVQCWMPLQISRETGSSLKIFNNGPEERGFAIINWKVHVHCRLCILKLLSRRIKQHSRTCNVNDIFDIERL